MAFSTELVARTGTLIDYRTLPTSVRTADTSAWSTILSTTVPAGTWLLVMDMRRSNKPSISMNASDIRVNGAIQEFRAGGAEGSLDPASPLRALATITGPATITVDARYVHLDAGTAHIARIG